MKGEENRTVPGRRSGVQEGVSGVGDGGREVEHLCVRPTGVKRCGWEESGPSNGAEQQAAQPRPGAGRTLGAPAPVSLGTEQGHQLGRYRLGRQQ